MLQIYVYGGKEEGFLDIAPQTKLDLESLADAFDEDLTNGEFSIPIEITWTDNNRRLLEFSEMLENGDSKRKLWKANAYDNGWPEIVGGQLRILEKIGKFNYKKGKFNCTVTGTKGLFGNLILNKKLKSLQLGGNISWVNKESRAFATDLMKGQYPNLNYIAFAPVAIENYFDTNRKDYDGEFLAKDTVNTVVITGSNADDWQFGRPKSTNQNEATVIGNSEHADFRTVPFFQFKFIVREIFKEFGFSVTGAFMDGTDFDNLYLFNNYSLENYITKQDFNRQINPTNHVEDILIADFLKKAFSAFKCYPIFDGSNNTVTLRYNYLNVTERNAIDISNYVLDSFETVSEADTENAGYSIEFGWNEKDEYYSERVKEITTVNNVTYVGDKELVATVATFSNLATLNIGRQLTTDDCAFVEAENMFYSVANASNNPILWDAYSENLVPEKVLFGSSEDEPSYTEKILISPLCTYVEENAAAGLTERRNYVGIRQKGSYQNNKKIRINNEPGTSFFYIKKQLINGVNMPTSYNHCKDLNNNKIENYSLSIKGEFGIAKNFLNAWLNVTRRSDVIKVKVDIYNELKHKLFTYNQVEIFNVVYLLKNVERTIPQTEPIQIYLTIL